LLVQPSASSANPRVHPTPWGLSVYDEIVNKLVERGIPREQIAAIGDAESDPKKQALFDKVRSGAIRVLLGSAQKMGTGTDAQTRLVALHHLDAPWKPDEVEQREGRILRQGNANREVSIFRYVTAGSFDAYMWQALETKARFIAQVITGTSAVRRAEDVGGQEHSYAGVKAIASGNPAVLTLAEAGAESQRLAVLKRNHADEQFFAGRNVRDLPVTIARLTQHAQDLERDRVTAEIHADDRLIIGDRSCGRDEALNRLAGLLMSLPRATRERLRCPLGICRGPVESRMSRMASEWHLIESLVVGLRGAHLHGVRSALDAGRHGVGSPVDNRVWPNRELRSGENVLAMRSLAVAPGPFEMRLADVDRLGRHADRSGGPCHPLRFHGPRVRLPQGLAV
jgi:hypothetical protein